MSRIYLFIYLFIYLSQQITEKTDMHVDEGSRARLLNCLKFRCENRFGLSVIVVGRQNKTFECGKNLKTHICL